uniref:Uncharacterized protein n=1 Tax=Utricularia reniformis TaxID=192314 RepID=A0A1Y0AZL9_9LAMI|nr:hypothetical protein AEK19_MT0316 [Utricularia reniformis]ART30590.1 hypothetical protein AEK19_MT0316 [Utricularia reniformis]
MDCILSALLPFLLRGKQLNFLAQWFLATGERSSLFLF